MVHLINTPNFHSYIENMTGEDVDQLVLKLPGLNRDEVRALAQTPRQLTELMCDAYIQARSSELLKAAREWYQKYGRGLTVLDFRDQSEYSGLYLSYADAQGYLGQYSLSFAKELRSYDPEREFVTLIIWHDVGTDTNISYAFVTSESTTG